MKKAVGLDIQLFYLQQTFWRAAEQVLCIAFIPAVARIE
jgi:hypothetical protein